MVVTKLAKPLEKKRGEDMIITKPNQIPKPIPFEGFWNIFKINQNEQNLKLEAINKNSTSRYNRYHNCHNKLNWCISKITIKNKGKNNDLLLIEVQRLIDFSLQENHLQEKMKNNSAIPPLKYVFMRLKVEICQKKIDVSPLFCHCV